MLMHSPDVSHLAHVDVAHDTPLLVVHQQAIHRPQPQGNLHLEGGGEIS